MSSNNSYLETKHFDSPSEFLDYLQPRNPRWLPSDADSIPWVFRGQRRSEWGLIPSAMRTDWFDEFKSQKREHLKRLIQDNIRSDEFRSNHDMLLEMLLQVAAEWQAVEEFVNLADQVGHPIPDDNRWGREPFSLQNLIKEFNMDYRPDKGYPTSPAGIEYSLAQHHGVPTRALDWTFLPFVASFFAAEEAVKANETLDFDIAVWSINYVELNSTDLEIVTQRRAKISFLHAQSGLFIYDRDSNTHYLKFGCWRTFEKALEDSTATTISPILRKVTLPAVEANELLRLLSAENITRAHIMPTYDNVTETLKLRRRLIGS